MKPRPLLLLVADSNEARLHAALSLVGAAAALGRRVHMFFQGEAVAQLRLSARFAGDAERKLFGTPTMDALFESGLDLGVVFTACQTGLNQMSLTPDMLRPGIETGGLVSALAALPDAELLIV
jgi:predicted peroxiredoxin